MPSVSSLSISNKANTNLNDASNGGDWDESAVVSNVSNPSGNAAAAELMDMKALEIKRSEQDDIAERLRVEETRAKLAAAREGMEKEAQRLKDEKEKKEAKKKEQLEAQSGRFGSAAGAVSSGIGGGGKWVPVHMRNSGGASSSAGANRFGAAAAATGYQRKVDTGDEELFPDLATADKLIQEEEDQKAAVAAAKQAAAAKKAKAEAQARRKAAEKAEAAERAREEEEEKQKELELERAKQAETATQVEDSSGAATLKKKKKKKKKDLSSFKPS